MRKKNKARISKYKKKGGNNFNFTSDSDSEKSTSSVKSTDSKGSTSSTGSTGSTGSPPPKKNGKPTTVASGKPTTIVPSTGIFNKLSSSFKNFSFSNSFSNITSGFNNTMKRWFSSKPADKKVTGGRTRKSRN